MPDKQSEFIVRTPAYLRLGYRVFLACRRTNKKKTTWLTEAIEEKADRDGVTLQSVNSNSRNK